jgi:hypothetical protein
MVIGQGSAQDRHWWQGTGHGEDVRGALGSVRNLICATETGQPRCNRCGSAIEQIVICVSLSLAGQKRISF